jgi:hypothetical protein
MPNLVAIGLGGLLAFGFEIWRRKINSPTRPWITCAVDALCSIPHAFKLGKELA